MNASHRYATVLRIQLVLVLTLSIGVTVVTGGLSSAQADMPAHVRNFINTYLPLARAQHSQYGVPVSVQLAQAGIETDWGRSEIMVSHNNFFAITSDGHSPRALGMYEVWVERAGRYYSYTEYATAQDSWLDFGYFLLHDPNYASALPYLDQPRIYYERIYCIYTTGKPTGCNTTMPLQIYDQWTSQYDAPAGIAASSTATVLVLDISGSMGDPWQGGVKLESAKRAAGDIVAMMEQESQVSGISHGVAIATFSTNAWLNLGLTTDYAQAKGVITGLVPTNRTNIGAGLQVANDALRSAPADAERIIILLSDGLTNEGLSPPEILSGPVQEAANAGTCIYTVGFGDRGALDEDLLRQIASGSRCGEYYYATDAYQLDNIYIKVRHQALGQIIAEFSGQVEQGRTTPPEEITVPPGKGELNISLVWPGSALDLIVTDPKGRRVDDSYPGASLVPYARFVYLIIKSPLSGLWRLAVFGREVPEGTIDYNAVASVREQTTPVSTDDRSVWVVALTLLLALVVAVFIALTQRQPAGAPAGVARGASVSVRQGYGPGGLVGFRRGVLGIGRDPRNELVLSDEQASRRHAQIRREPEGLVIYDLNSKNGTYVNGQRVGRCLLRNSDEIRVGDTLLTFHSPV